MSSDKHKALASRAAYLRTAIGREGFAVNVKHAYSLTPFLMRMIAEGELVMRRQACGGRKRVSVLHATDAGTARLKALEDRFGTSFGSKDDILRVDPPRPPKSVRRLAANPEPRHVATARKAARAARILAFRMAEKAKGPVSRAATAG